ncbi:unnamed protein product, partial [Allacma fusca]
KLESKERHSRLDSIRNNRCIIQTEFFRHTKHHSVIQIVDS